MTKTEYAKYLQSEHWLTLRQKFLEFNNHCYECDIPRWLAELVYDQDLHVHHRHYSSRGRETNQDLEALCRRCHEVKTFGRSELKVPKVATCELCETTHWDYRARFCQGCERILYCCDDYIVDLCPRPYPLDDYPREVEGNPQTMRSFLQELLGHADWWEQHKREHPELV